MEIFIQHVEAYLEGLPKPEATAIALVLDRLEHEGHMLRMPFSRPLRQGLFELRVDRHRIIYFFGRGRAILTNGFKKKTGQTPGYEIEKALRVKKLYS